MTGAPDLVRQLHRGEGSRLLRFFRRGLASPQDAADAVQETFLRMLRAPRPDEIADPQAYLYAVARSVAIEAGRRTHLERAMIADLPDAVDQIASDAPEIERRIAAKQELVLMARAIRGLPRRCQQVFILSRLHGQSNGQIALSLGISRNMVEKHIMRALLTCRALRWELAGG
ncbi:RNA polymerase sigma factor [Paracoccus aminophilus]|uniref:RNA polymerase, sigma-24 subunit n=1 Tax=Paracoccus aminophilus JCM 7686 TaxID=1367847 RepID=S5Y4J6_PARAH|nr:sigma-70 family RNA polymerase sigma factor [Paracoccus aminophilus]AGT10660.1 RNA polymerase, sigma-24 subunit [Paracoccus aminophilus JCM 7686]